MTGLGKTAWVDRHLGLAWERVRAAVPKEDWLPQVIDEGGVAKTSFTEYGCGHYGCVMPTYDDGVVMKLTSDETEAYFVAAALSMNDPNAWNGLTEYYAIYLSEKLDRGPAIYVSDVWGHYHSRVVDNNELISAWAAAEAGVN